MNTQAPKPNGVDGSAPILVELGDENWSEWLDRAAKWFESVLLSQRAFSEQLEDTIGRIREPHIKRYLEEMLDKEREHERRAEDLFHVIGRKPTTSRKLGAALVSKARGVLADVQGIMGGAAGAWKDLRELLVASMDAKGAFAIAEQIGLALGLPAIAEITFVVANEKTVHQMLLQEYVLEMAPMSILYRAPVEAPAGVRRPRFVPRRSAAAPPAGRRKGAT